MVENRPHVILVLVGAIQPNLVGAEACHVREVESARLILAQVDGSSVSPQNGPLVSDHRILFFVT